MRPFELRPPDFFSPSVSDFSGSDRVISAKSGYVTNRRPGDVGFGLRIGIGYSAPCSPLKIGIVSPSATCTIAFFH